MVRDAPAVRAPSRTKSRRGPPARCSSRTTRASTTASSSTRSRALERAFSARVLCTVRLSRRLFPDEPRHNLDSVIARHALAGRRAASRARRRARAVGVRAGALSRPRRRRRSRPRRSASCKTPSLPPQLAAGRARRAARGAGRLSLLRPQRAAALHRQEHATCASASARISRPTIARATDLRLSQRDPAHRIRGDGRRDRRAAARGGAREVDAARAQPRAAAQGRIGRARAARRAGTAALRSRRGASSRASSPAATGRSRRSAQARETLRSLAAEHALCWKALGLEKRLGPCFARQVKRCAGACVGAESADGASRAPCARRSRRYAIPRVALSPGSPRIRERVAAAAIASTCTCSATGAGSAPRATTASSAASSRRRRVRCSTPTSRGC